jgi:uncharacterized protein (DUF697 family)
MFKKLTHDKLLQILNWAYENSIQGLPFAESAIELANNFLKKPGLLRKQASSLIKWQVAKSGTTGFLTGLGGLITLPFTVPVDFAVVIFIQIRMIAAIAHMGGYDLKDDRVKTLVYLCMAGDASKDIVKNTGILIGKKITASIVKKISGKTITSINQKVGFRLLTKFGEKGAVNLVKLIPLVGGFVGLIFDSGATYTIGRIAINTFIHKEDET